MEGASENSIADVTYWRVEPSCLQVNEKDQPTYGCKVDPRHPNTEKDFEYYVEPDAKQRIRFLKKAIAYNIWFDDKWQRHLCPYLPANYTAEDVLQLYLAFEDGVYDPDICGFSYNFEQPEDHYRMYKDLRELYAFLMEHNQPAMKLLLDSDYAHVGENLFPLSEREEREDKGESIDGRCTRSLLEIAVFQIESPEAVEMLLEYGADPKYCYDELLSPEYYNRLDSKDTNDSLPKIYELLTTEVVKRINRATQRWHNVLAIVRLIRKWRQVTVEPGSKLFNRTMATFHEHVGSSFSAPVAGKKRKQHSQ